MLGMWRLGARMAAPAPGSSMLQIANELRRVDSDAPRLQQVTEVRGAAHARLRRPRWRNLGFGEWVVEQRKPTSTHDILVDHENDLIERSIHLSFTEIVD